MFLAALGLLLPSTVHAVPCSGPLGGPGLTEVDEIITSCPSDGDLVIDNTACLGAKEASIEDNTFNCNIHVSGGALQVGGEKRQVVVKGNIEVDDMGELFVVGEVHGNIELEDDAFVEFALEARVFGNVEHEGPLGYVDFIGKIPSDNPDKIGAQVFGNIELEGGAELRASGPNQENFVGGNIECETPTGGSATDWDGDGTKDGTIGGNFECPEAED
jgi:hypothetical protein